MTDDEEDLSYYTSDRIEERLRRLASFVSAATEARGEMHQAMRANLPVGQRLRWKAANAKKGTTCVGVVVRNDGAYENQIDVRNEATGKYSRIYTQQITELL